MRSGKLGSEAARIVEVSSAQDLLQCFAEPSEDKGYRMRSN